MSIRSSLLILLLATLVCAPRSLTAEPPRDGPAVRPLDELVRVSVVEDQLRIDWIPATAPPPRPVMLRGPEGQWQARAPAPTRGVAPMTLELQRPPAGTRDRAAYWYVHIASSPQQLFIRGHRGGRAAAANTLRFQQLPDGAVHLVVLDNVDRQFVQARAANIVELRTRHPELVRLYLVPLLRQLTGDDALLPGATDVYRVFSEVSPDPRAQEQLAALLPKLADRDYAAREAASRQLARLGPPAVCAVLRMDLDALMPEQRARLNQFLLRNSRRSIDRPEAMLDDVPFLADCVEFDDDRVRREARARVEHLTGQRIPMHPAPTPAEWSAAADVVRSRFARAGQ